MKDQKKTTNLRTSVDRVNDDVIIKQKNVSSRLNWVMHSQVTKNACMKHVEAYGQTFSQTTVRRGTK